jgi:hypothetical protein
LARVGKAASLELGPERIDGLMRRPARMKSVPDVDEVGLKFGHVHHLPIFIEIGRIQS